MHIVYVEDNQANVFLVKRVAKMGNHLVTNLIQGEDAIEKMRDLNPDIILMDVQLAGEMSGLDVTRALRDQGITTPIVAVTAYAMVGDKERCLEAGCNYYLPKPLPIPELIKLFEDHDPNNPKKPAVKKTGTLPAINVPETTSNHSQETEATTVSAEPIADKTNAEQSPALEETPKPDDDPEVIAKNGSASSTN